MQKGIQACVHTCIYTCIDRYACLHTAFTSTHERVSHENTFIYIHTHSYSYIYAYSSTYSFTYVSTSIQPTGKGSKLLRYVEHRLRVTLQDGRIIIGTFLAFDKHLNLVLSEAEEFRTLRSKGGAALLEERTEKRALGLVLVRGENVISLAVEGPPPPSVTGKLTPGGPGVAHGAGRGMPPVGLGAGPPPGMGSLPPPPPPGYAQGMPPPGMGRGMPPGY